MMITEMESPYVVFYISLMVVIFCSGVILGAYLIACREEKMLKYFRDEVLTKEQKSDILSKDLATEIFVKKKKKDT